jgi:uncharacterized glyoxalase superfamily protein PhnB
MKLSRQPNANAIRPVPEGYTTVTPWIISRDTVALLDFVKKAFNVEEIARVPNEDGSIGHAEFKIGDAIVMGFDWDGELETPSFLRLYVPDGDAIYQQAIAAGATAITEMTNLAWGDRVGRVRDPFGNIWWIQTRLEELDPTEMEKRSQEKQYLDAMQYVQLSLDRELSSRARS